jgi:hypothetical protein
MRAGQIDNDPIIDQDGIAKKLDWIGSMILRSDPAKPLILKHVCPRSGQQSPQFQGLLS